ncbi:MAG: type I 3-dehydroquinate dehydratase [Promethearchaeota archaeon]
MNAGKICLAIRVVDEASALRGVEVAKNMGVDLVELRWDYCEVFSEIDLSKFLDLGIPTIFTYRARDEGGFDVIIEEQDRRDLLFKFVSTGADYVDVEISTGEEFIHEIDELASKTGTKLIFSWHDFEKTPSEQELWGKVELLESYGVELDGLDKIVKVITTAREFADNIKVLNLCRKAREGGVKICTHCMGSLGIFSRVVGGIYGNEIVYASSGEKTAPGQISVDELRQALRILGH